MPFFYGARIESGSSVGPENDMRMFGNWEGQALRSLISNIAARLAGSRPPDNHRFQPY